MRHFFVFEGDDYAGKSSQLKALYRVLVSQGYDVVLTREIGGTPFAERIRELVLTSDPQEVDDYALAAVIMAARRNHVKNVILPAIKRNKIVLCDRFIDSTYIYQGMMGGCDLGYIRDLYNQMVKEFVIEPPVIFDLSIDYGTYLRRKAERNEDNDRLDFISQDDFLYRSVVKKQRFYSYKHEADYLAIDANGDFESIHKDILFKFYQFVKD